MDLICDAGICKTPVCPQGEQGCACYPNMTCNQGLLCEDGTCTADCQGQQGCGCYPNMTCNQGLECIAGLCEPPVCPLGDEGCECYPNLTCNDELVCMGGLCVADMP